MANISIGGRLSLLQRVASLDLRYGPYSSIADAYENMGPSGDEVITAGLPFGVTEDDGSVSVYIWTKGEDATQNDCRKLDKEHVVLFNGFIDISVSIKQQRYNYVATKDNIVFLSDRKQFAYRDGLNFYINWKNRYVWSNENLIPYDDVIYIDINDNKAYYYNGTTLTLLASETFVSSINNQAPDSEGNVNLTKEHIGLEKVDNTSDAEKVVKGASEDGSGNVITTTYETKADATTKQTTLQGAINALQTSVAALTGLDSTNFGGFSIQSTEADAISNIATLYTADGYTDELLWYMAGTSLSSVKAYRYNGSGTPTAISSDSYDCLDFSGLIADVSTLSQNLAALGPKIGQIEASINGAEDTRIDFSNTLPNGYYQYSNGLFVDTSSAWNTGLIEIGNAKTIKYKGNLGSIGAVVAFFDENSNYIKSLSVAGNNVTEGTITLDSSYSSAKYVCVSNYGSSYLSVSYLEIIRNDSSSIKPRLSALEEWQSNVVDKMEEYDTEIEKVKDVSEDIDAVKTIIGMADSFGLVEDGYYQANGVFVSTSSAKNSGFVSTEGYDTLEYYGQIGSVGGLLLFYDSSKSLISALTVVGTGSPQYGTIDLSETEYADVKYVRLSVYGSAWFNAGYIKLYNTSEEQIIPRLEKVEKYVEENEYSIIKPDDFSLHGYISALSGNIASNESYRATPFIELTDGITEIGLFGVYAGPSSRILCFYDSNKSAVGTVYSNIDARTNEYVVSSIPQDAVYFRCGSEMSAMTDKTYVKWPANVVEQVKSIGDKVSSLVNASKLFSCDNPNVLIFGDSITAAAAITIDTENNETTAYSLLHPSNSYVNSQGDTVRFDMWPYFIKERLQSDLRCYAKSGASYHTQSRTSGNELQNLELQINVAINDLDNPNSVFPTVGTFVPDIVIFALGTNDGAPASGETYANSMAKTVFTDGVIDVDATISALDWSDRADAIHCAFLKVKKYFPYALTFVILPIQRSSSEMIGENSMGNLIRQFAERYSIHVIDGAKEMGIVRDFASDVDIYLKDGLHPNDKGQNLFARLVLAAIRKEWVNMSLLNP